MCISWLLSAGKNLLSDGLKSINSSAFQKCTSLEVITILTTVSVLGTGIFSFCTRLKTVILCSGLECINGYAFSHCTSLDKIIIPDSITDLGQRSFEGCSQLKNVVLSEGLQ